MLPGFRILFAIVLLSVSVLVFGVGAAAFLRAAHDNLASLPSYRPIEAAYAPRIEPRLDLPTAETLSMMRIETAKELGAPALRADQPASLSVARQADDSAAIAPTAVAEAPAQPADAQKTDDLTTASVTAPPVEAARPAPALDISAPAVAPPAPSQLQTMSVPVTPAPTIASTTEMAGQDSLTPADRSDTYRTETHAAVQSPSPAIEPSPNSAARSTDAESSQASAPAQVETSPKPDRVAALPEPLLDAQPPLPISKVKIPKPRIDPKVIEAKQNELRVRQQREVRAQAQTRARAKRIAAVRAARTAAQTRAADPFAAPTTFQQTPAAR